MNSEMQVTYKLVHFGIKALDFFLSLLCAQRHL